MNKFQTYFTSDLHVGHANVIRHCNRPYSSVEEMDEALINNWNSMVLPGDLVYILGDFVWKVNDIPKALSRLNGDKVLISGNHDQTFIKHKKAQKFYHLFKKWGFLEVYQTLPLKIGPYRVLLSHLPYKTDKTPEDYVDKYYDFKPTKTFEDALLCGHVHNRWRIKEDPLQINVGVDQWGFYPVSAKEIEETIRVYKECQNRRDLEKLQGNY